jgi:density-regulated protein DRP1
LSVAAQERAAKDAAKKAAKAEAAEQKHADKLAKSVVTIKRIERNKRKFVTAVSGLEAFGLDLKKVRPCFSFLVFFPPLTPRPQPTVSGPRCSIPSLFGK